jgi:hypothetical protein
MLEKRVDEISFFYVTLCECDFGGLVLGCIEADSLLQRAS